MSNKPLPWENLSRDGVKPLKRAGIVVDPRRCVGCHACAVACKSENDVPLGGFRIRTHYLQRPDKPKHFFLPMMCQHCQDAPCIPACPNDAIVRGKDGRVDINKADCRMDTACTKACPYDAIHIDEQANKADKCNLCPQRTEVGLDPACVEVCPTEALRFGDLGDLDSDVSRYADKHGAKMLRPEHETRPTVVYAGLEPWMEKQAKGVQLQQGENDIVYERKKED
jgi:Fe-S-cluster-containing dehydrogenase component